jgi:glycine/D-amino acid oxidase-like deaminating enzyme
MTWCCWKAERIGWGASGRNGGHVGTGQRVDQTRIEEWVGLDTAKALWQLSLEAVERVCGLIDQHDIDCELGVGNLHLAAKPSHAQELQAEKAHLETVYGYEGLTYLSPEQTSALTSARGFHGALLDTGCRHLHPLKVRAGVSACSRQNGGQDLRGYSWPTACLTVVQAQSKQIEAVSVPNRWCWAAMPTSVTSHRASLGTSCRLTIL